jgi:hypothetical protein
MSERFKYFQDWSSILLQPNMWIDHIAHRHINMEIGNEAAQFPEKKYIDGICVAVCCSVTFRNKIVFFMSH